MTVLLDSDAIINWLPGMESEVTLVAVERRELSISVITTMEVLEGIREQDEGARKQWDRLLALSSLFNVDLESAGVAAGI